MLPRTTRPLQAGGRARVKFRRAVCPPGLSPTSMVASKQNNESSAQSVNALREHLSPAITSHRSAGILLPHIMKEHEFDTDLLQRTLNGPSIILNF